jgi:hypothetical protein
MVKSMNLAHKNKEPDFLHSDYFILATGLSIGTLAYFLAANQLALQVGATIGTGLFYILWGTIHHAREGDFHLKILVEYTLIAVLAMSLLLTLIIRT